MAESREIYRGLVIEFDASKYSVDTCPPAALLFAYQPGPTLDAQYDERGRRPRIIIDRPDLTAPLDHYDPVDIAMRSPSPVAELVAVAHELGHHHSWLTRTYTRFEDADTDERLAEEMRAWQLGRMLLHSRGFTAWDVFARDETARLEEYRTELGISPSVADAIAARIGTEVAQRVPLRAVG